MKTTNTKSAVNTAPKAKVKAAVPKNKVTKELLELFMDEIKTIYRIEKEFNRAMPKLIKNIANADLSETLTRHLHATKKHILLLEKAFTFIGEKDEAITHEPMTGLISQALKTMETTERGIVKDAGIMLASKKLVHYEIAIYDSLCTFAKTLGEFEAAAFLKESLEEKKALNKKLSGIAESFINAKVKTIVVLNSLIEINNDRIEGYTTASNETKESELKSLFSEFSKTSQKCKQELVNEVHKLGGTPIEGTKTTGKFFRVWMDVKAALTGKDRKAILDSCEFGENKALDTYKDALKNNIENLSGEEQTMLKNQQMLIKADHDKVKSLHNKLLVHS